jgi:hypothetical protein
MQVSRSQVTTALYNLLSGCYAWNNLNSVQANGRLQLGDDVPAYEQPALYLVKGKETWDYRKSYGAIQYTLEYNALILVRAGGSPEDTTAETVMDNILDAIDRVMSPQPGYQFQTLGGLVYNCYVNGPVEIDPPILHDQAAIWVPILVVTGQ